MRPDEPESTDDDVAVAVVMEPEEGTPSEDPGASRPEARGGPEETTSTLDDGELLRAVAALVFASPEPLTERKLAALCAGEGPAPAPARIRATLDALAQRLSASGLPLELRSIAGGWRILTAPETGPVVQRLFEARKSERISPAALETLAIVAYRQPVTKAEIEAIRGVQAGPVLRALVDRDLIKVAGRADVPGHPLQYATTKNFLDRFGLSGLDDLPRDSELAR